MKKMKRLFFALTLSTVLFSCGKDKNKDNKEPDGGKGSMSAKVDGAAWNASLAVQGTKTSGVLSIGGNGDGKQINIALPSYSGPDTYTFGVGSFNTATYVETSGSKITTYTTSVVLSGGGSVIVEKEEGGYVEGTFSFGAKHTPGPGETASGVTKNIIEGKFKVKI